ncbi:prolipoprotein diacylglyceryl transferase [bacterium]|nr:prolipoprotein diacylglyceryl transferase [bacterium]
MGNAYWQHPDFDPVIIHLWGPLQIRWYSLLYVGAFLVARVILKRLAREQRFKFTEDDMEQFIVWSLLGAVVGARIIYCLVYDPAGLMSDPLYLFKVYQGGLSFHGGLLGVIVAAVIFSHTKKIPFWNLADAMALCCPPGLAMGRLGNFINAELYGRVTNVPWAMVFPHAGAEPRHPSQLYELFLEGILLCAVLWFLKSRVRRDGVLAMVFLFGYTLARFIVEFFRQPDSHIGFLLFGLSMGQWLSVVMLVASVVTAVILSRRPVPEETKKKKKKK